MKKIDLLILRMFFPPFLATLMVSVFLFFLVQIVITYLDDFVGKGLRASDLLTLFWYAWITMIPQCIPLAVLLASIMCFGNLAEHYELATMKASGISLFRIIRPVFVFICMLSVFTFLFNNNILPHVYLKFSLLLSDIRSKKPTIHIKEGIFYNQITNYVIRVGKKDKNSDTLRDVIIYDHSGTMGNFVQIYAKCALLQYNADTSRLILKLFRGKRYEHKPRSYSHPENTTQIMAFGNLNVFIDIRDFKFRRTDEKHFKGAEEMLNISQLNSIADSTRMKIANIYSGRYDYSKKNIFIKFFLAVPVRKTVGNCPDSVSGAREQKLQWTEMAMNILRNYDSYLENTYIMEKNEKNYLTNLEIEWHRKWVLSVACVVLFFIGAPLGAIIRKGGIGLPVVVAVMFFLGYYILTEFFTGLTMEYILSPLVGMWIPVMIFLPVSIFLTVQAASEAAWLDLQSVVYFFQKFLSRFGKHEGIVAV